MATGAPGTNGVWQYGEDDSEATFSALLNKVASTADSSIGTDRGRITTAEGKIASLESTSPGTVGHPWKQSGGYVTTSASAQVTVTFPSGRFSLTPNTIANVVAHANVSVAYLTNPTPVSIGIGAFTLGGARISAGVWWQALQMQSTNPDG